MKGKFKAYFSLFLLVLMSIGLTISTLHSHHHLEWSHSSDFVDTGHCLTEDTTVCPISGYIFETDVLSASYFGEAFFKAKEFITDYHIFIDDYSTSINRGRSPPALI